MNCRARPVTYWSHRGSFFFIFPEIYRFIAVGTSREVVQSNLKKKSNFFRTVMRENMLCHQLRECQNCETDHDTNGNTVMHREHRADMTGPHPILSTSSHSVQLMMASANKAKVAVSNGTLGYLKGENFSPQSNFVITRILAYVKFGDEKGYFVRVKESSERSER